MWYPPFHPKNFLKPKIFSKTVGFPYESFRHCETWKFRLKIVICPLLSINFFDTRNFPKNRRVPLQSFSFRSCETKSSDKTVMPPLIQTFSLPEINATVKDSPTVIFGTVRQKRQKIFDGKSWYSPPPLSKLFRYPKLVKHLRVPLRNFLALWDKKFSTGNFDTPSLLSDA